MKMAVRKKNNKCEISNNNSEGLDAFRFFFKQLEVLVKYCRDSLFSFSVHSTHHQLRSTPITITVIELPCSHVGWQ